MKILHPFIYFLIIFDVKMELLSTLLFLIVFIMILWKYKPLCFPLLPNWLILFGFVLKFFVGFIFTYVYIYYYPKNIIPSDAIRFLHDSKEVNQIFYESPKIYFQILFGLGNDEYLLKHYLNNTYLWDSGSLSLLNDFRNVIRFHSIIQFISNGSALIHTLFMCFISFIGIQQIYKSIQPLSLLKPNLVFISILLIPSMLFWTSGILKEPFVLLGIGLILRLILLKEPLKNKITPFVISIIILICFKPYVLICLFPAFIYFAINKYVFNYKYIASIVLIFSIIVLVAILMPSKTKHFVNFATRKQFNFSNIGRGGLHIKGDTCFYYIPKTEEKNITFSKDKKHLFFKHRSRVLYYAAKNAHPTRFTYISPSTQNWIVYANDPRANSFFETTPINYSIKQMILNIPEAISNALFRPFLFDEKSKLKIPALIESFGVSLFIIICVIYRKNLTKEQLNLIQSILVFSLFLLLVIGWVTPISGAIFRYRFPVQLSFVLIGLLLINPTKFKLTKIQK
jgi:hypothetical protein